MVRCSCSPVAYAHQDELSLGLGRCKFLTETAQKRPKMWADVATKDAIKLHHWKRRIRWCWSLIRWDILGLCFTDFTILFKFVLLSPNIMKTPYHFTTTSLHQIHPFCVSELLVHSCCTFPAVVSSVSWPVAVSVWMIVMACGGKLILSLSVLALLMWRSLSDCSSWKTPLFVLLPLVLHSLV